MRKFIDSKEQKEGNADISSEALCIAADLYFIIICTNQCSVADKNLQRPICR